MNVTVSKAAKFWLALVGAAVVAAQAAVTDGSISPQEWVTVALAVLTAAGVWVVPNAKPSA